MARSVPFPLYVACNILGRLPWKRRYLNLFGPRGTTTAPVIAAVKVTFLTAAALGRGRPDLVPTLLGPEPYAALYDVTSRNMQERVESSLLRGYRGIFANTTDLVGAYHQAAQADVLPRRYEDLFPEDAEASQDVRAWRTVVHQGLALAAVQLRVEEGLVFGERYPELAGRVLQTAISESCHSRENARQVGVDLGPIWERVEDAERDAQGIAATWQSLEAG